MSDFKNNNNHDSPVIEPFRELAASQDVAPKQEEQEPDNPETTGSLPQIPDYYHCYGPDQGHHIHGLEHEDATALHDGGGGGGDSSSPPAFPLMPLHIPVRSDPDELLAAVPGMNHHQDEHYIVHLQDQQQQQQQPQYLWHAGDSHYHHRQHQHHDTDGFAYGDTSSPSSPAVSWASSLSTLPDHLAHADDPWHGLSPTSPPELASPDADSLAASPEWHYEHVAASPLDDFVGMNVHAPRSPAPSPADCLPSMVTPYIPSEHHHYFLGSGGGAATVAGSVPDHVYLNEQGRSALASASLRAQMVNQSAASPNTTSSTAAAAAAAANADGPPYAQLIFCALMSRADRCMSLQEIYQWFRENTDKHRAGGKGWQNSIRHNLSMNRGFIKRERKEAAQNGGAVAPLIDEVSGEPKRSTEWTLQDWAVEHGVQSTTRYRGNKTSSSRNSSSSSRARRRSSPGSPYRSPASSSSPYNLRRSGGPYNSRVASLHHHHHNHHGHSSAAGSMMRAPTSHYYPTPSPSSSSDPYREQLMHEAMMAQGTPPIKRESTPPSPPPPPPPPPAETGSGYGNVMLPGYHGLLQTLEPEFPFGTQHVHVGYPPSIMPGANHDDDENGCGGGGADASGNGQNVYGQQQHPY